MKKYFAYDENDGLYFFDTEAEARDYCGEGIGYWREDGFGDIPNIVWGEVKQFAKEIRAGDERQYCDLEMTDVEG